MSRFRMIAVLVLTGLAGGMATDGCSLSVPGLPSRTAPSITTETSSVNPRLVTLGVDLSQFPEARTINWDFGDDAIATNLAMPGGAQVVHVYSGGGAFTVRMFAFDFSRQKITDATKELVVSGSAAGGPPPPPGPTRVKLATNHGDIILEMDQQAAPLTVANFLQYVDEGHYTNVVFHRVVKDFVIQAGAFKSLGEGADPRLQEFAPTHAPVTSEAHNGLSNVRGTVAMAMRGQDANSGTNQFFINLISNTNLDNGPPPFTVFAHVVEGLDVVDAIATVATGSFNVQTTNGTSQSFDDVPVQDVTILSATRQ